MKRKEKPKHDGMTHLFLKVTIASMYVFKFIETNKQKIQKKKKEKKCVNPRKKKKKKTF